MGHHWSLGLKSQTPSAFSNVKYDFKPFTIMIMFSGRSNTTITEHCVWSHDGHVVTKNDSHLNLIAMSLLQTCSYVTEQMQSTVSIDVNKFLESFSIKDDTRGEIHPPFWIAGEDDSVTISPTTTLNPNSQSGSLTPSSKPFTMEDYSRCRRAEAIRWINLQEKRASIMARLQPAKPEEYQERRDAVNSASGPLRRKGIKSHLSSDSSQT